MVEETLNEHVMWSGSKVNHFVCAYHPPTPGLSPKHPIYAFIIYSQICAIFVS